MADPAERVTIGRTGVSVTRLGLGGTPFGNLFRSISDEALAGAFEAAWEGGIRYFDTAPQYGGGLSEQRMGRLLASKPRDAYVLSTKVGKLVAPAASGRAPDGIFAHGLANDIRYDYTYDGAMRSIEQSLLRLGLDRIDLVLIHDVNRKYHGDGVWDVYRTTVSGACRALAKLRDEKVIAGFGPANREMDVNLRMVAEVDVDCLMLPSRFTLLDHSAAAELLPLCTSRNVAVLVAGPFESGILATGAVSDAMFAYGPAGADVRERVAAMAAACRSAGTSLPAAALQFPLRHPAVASVVTGFATADEVAGGLAAFRASVPETLWPMLARHRLA